VVLRGRIWTGWSTEPLDGLVVVTATGTVGYLGPDTDQARPGDLTVLGDPECWIGPGIIDTHVHLAHLPGSALDALLPGGVVAVRDLGAAPNVARALRTGHRTPPAGRPFVAVSGPVITAVHGYPSDGWGAHGESIFVASAGQAPQVVQRLAADGVDVIKIAMEPGRGAPVPGPKLVRAVVEAAHATGLSVVAHALNVDMVRRAVAAGVDELAHVPTERLPEDVVAALAAANVSVVSTLQAFFSAGVGRDAAANASALVEAGVRLRYGTAAGTGAGTLVGVDPRELDRLADAGLGRAGALRAATEDAARAAGIRGRSGRLRVGERAALVLLPGDPLIEPGVWRAPRAVLADGAVLTGGPA
jgi:imidazolonepropionase-like amidohydrolase